PAWELGALSALRACIGRESRRTNGNASTSGWRRSPVHSTPTVQHRRRFAPILAPCPDSVSRAEMLSGYGSGFFWTRYPHSARISRNRSASSCPPPRPVQQNLPARERRHIVPDL